MNLRNLAFSFIALIVLSGCASGPTGDRAYHKLIEQSVDAHLAQRPQDAVALGFHQYDGKVTDLSRESIEHEHARLLKVRDDLIAIRSSTLSFDAQRERRVRLTDIEAQLFQIETMQAYSTNPMTYAGAIDVNLYAKRDYAPIDQRARAVIQTLTNVPAMLKNARTNLATNLPRVYITQAIENADGQAEFLTGDLQKAFAPLKDQALREALAKSCVTAASEYRAFCDYLKTDKLPHATEDYAIGDAGFSRMLHEMELIDLTPEQVLAIGMTELKREQANFAAAAKKIDPSRPAIEVFKSIQKDHPFAEGLLPDTRKHLEQIRQFVIDHKLVTVPSEERAKVEETPPYARAGSFASMDTPGPFEKSAEAYYYVTPVEPEWDAAQKEQWLSAFNYYTTDVVSIHEAYPGHYIQFLHLNRSPISRADKVFGNYAFIEGWAHYSEQMMLDEGFPGSADPIVQAKSRLAQSDEALLRLCRLCVAIQMHCQKMTVDQATKFFRDNCYYEEKPARAEAERGTYDPGYCLYTLGKLQLLKLREDYRKQEGANFSLQRFHDLVLSHGAPPVRILREYLLKDSTTWESAL